METFLYSTVNIAQVNEYVNKIDTLGPFLKILDLILYKANSYREDRQLSPFTVYRSLLMTNSQI